MAGVDGQLVGGPGIVDILLLLEQLPEKEGCLRGPFRVAGGDGLFVGGPG